MASDSRRRPPSRGNSSPARQAELVVLRHAVIRKYLSTESVQEAQRRQARLGAAGKPADLLTVLATFVPETTLAELTAVYRRAVVQVETREAVSRAGPRTARAGAPPVPRPEEVPVPVGQPVGDDGPSRSRVLRFNRKTALIGGVCLAGLLAIAVPLGIWLFGDSGGDAGDSAAAQVELVALLATRPGDVLPGAEHLLSRVVTATGGVDVRVLRELLSGGPTAVRLNTARLLALLGDPAALPLLEGMLQDPDELTRIVALDCAGRFKGRPPLPELVRSLSSARTDVRGYAIRALEESGSVAAVDSLLLLLDHTDPTTRLAAARAVLALKPSALDTVRQRLAGGTPRAVAAVAKPPIEEEPSLPDEPDITGPLRRPGDFADGELDIAGLPPEIAGGDGATPEAEARPAAGTGKPEAGRVTGPEPETKPKPKTKPKTKPKAEPKPAAEPKVPAAVRLARRDVPSLLEGEKHREAVELLERAIQASAKDAELHRLLGLAHLGLGDAEKAAADFHRAVDLAPDLAVAYFDLSVCYAVQGKKRNAHAALVMALRFGFRDILAIRNEERLDLIKESTAFRELMEHYFHLSLAADRDDAKRQRLAFKQLQAAFQSKKDPYLRALAVVHFPEAGPLESTELLYRYMKDSEFIVRRALAELLSRTRDPGSIGFLCEQVRNSRAPAHQRQALMWALAGLEGPGVIEAILTGLTDRSLAVKIAAAAAIGDRPDRRAVEPLFDLLEKIEPLERLVVAESLGKITGKDLGLEPVDWRNWWAAHGQELAIGPVRSPCAGSESKVPGTVVIPPAFSERTGKEKLRALARYGGSRQTEEAVAKALEWLSRHQNQDGRWDTDEWALRCDERKAWERVTRVRQRSWDVQVTGLALMAFLGSGYTHVGGKYHETVRRGLEFLGKRQRQDGYFSGDHHYRRSHEIATIAVTEAYLLTRDCDLRPVVERAIGWILRKQYDNGGWGWFVRESHTYLTGWNLMALTTAAEAGLTVPAFSLVSARHFLDRVTLAASDGNRPVGFAYDTLRPAAQVGESLSVEEHEDVLLGGSTLSTIVALWCRTFLGQTPRDPRVTGALAQLRKSFPRLDKDGEVDIDERLFYGAQAALLQGGSLWKDWNESMKKALLGAIVRDGCERGSWAPSGDHGRVHATALGALLLESYYRFRPDARR